jgi:hypothetical protein
MALCGLAGIYAQRRLWDYHWVSTMPFMALVAALAIRATVETLLHCNNSRWRKMVWLLPLVGVGLALPMLRVHGDAYLDTIAYVSGHRSELEHLKAFGMRDVSQVADYVHRRTTDEDYLFIWGHYPAVYYLAGRQNPTRFGMDPPLSLNHDKQRLWQQECMSNLHAHPPEYILIVTDDITPFEPITSKQQLSGFPELEDFLNKEYVYDRRVGDFEVYARLSQPENPINAQFEGGITLVGYDLYENLQPDGTVAVELYWSSDTPVETDYTVFVQMVDWSGPLVVAQSDTYPAHGQRPTRSWQPGLPVLDTHDLILPVDLQPGEYEIIVGMYDLNTMERLPVISGGTADNYVSLGKLTYKPED